jgi:AAA domain
MSGLDFVKPDERPKTWNTLLYGPSGKGKTMGALSAPGPILLVNADGPDSSRKGHAIYGEKIKEVVLDKTNASLMLKNVYLELVNGSEFKTVVFDTMGEIYTALLDEWSNSGKIGLNLRGDASVMIERYVRSLRDLPYNVILVAQEQIEDSETDDGKERIVKPLVGPREGLLWVKVIQAMSIVAYVGEVPAKDGQPKRWVGQLVESKGRRTKDRSEALGAYRDLDLTEWFTTATASMGATQPEPEVDKKSLDKPKPTDKAKAKSKEKGEVAA